MHANIIFISGPRNGGKTTTLLSYLERNEQKFHFSEIGGFVAIANKEKNCYRLKNLSTGEERVAICETALPNAIRWGRFFIDSTVFAWANQTIIEHLNDYRLVVFDELGRFELEGLGFDQSFHRALGQPGLLVLATVRTSFLCSILQRYGLDESEVELIRCEELKPMTEGIINCLE
ncbi:nucleoside-triphosphatase [uncultured Sphaerochaeta sp.]|uniref:nucleoside-triphosphatase n=1 Tax=uncultured Sphaerochaeta sp. TaxID=886478 RepID=UPI002A0A4C95|nr:nucleoside-triphosphatase [uncultured Sphaerochaeta sp.]